MRSRSQETRSCTRRVMPFNGMTLAELTVVLAVLGVLLAMVLPSLSSSYENSSRTVTDLALKQVRETILGTYYDDAFETLPYPLDPVRVEHPQLAYLFVAPLPGLTFDPVTRRGWRGPYLLSGPGGKYVISASRGFTPRYGLDGDPAPLDGWGHPIVLQQPVMTGSAASSKDLLFARLVSAGPNGILETPWNVLVPTLAERGDDVILGLGVSP